jgi:hypothetical protein
MAIPITNQDLSNNPQTGQQNQNGQNQPGQPGQAPTVQPYNPNKQVGSGYTNINRIVNANQNNRLGSTIGSNIQQAGQQATQNINQAGQDFQTNSNANRLDTGQNQQLVQNVLADPTKAAQNSQQVNQFGTLMSGNYQGPTGLANAGQLQAQAQDVNQMGQAIGSSAGRQGLLQRFVGNPQYNSGQQSMDNLLLGQTGGKDLAAARQSTTGVQNLAQNQIGGATAAAQEYANRAKQFGQGVQQQFGNTVNQAEQGLTQQAQTAQQARDAKVSALQAQMGQGNINQTVANQLGITQGENTYNLTPQNFVSENAQQANAQNIASAQDYARMQALQQLGGGNAPSAAQQTLGQFTDPSKAGTFQAANAYNVDAPGFQQNMAAAQQSNQDFINANVNPDQANYNNAVMQALHTSAAKGTLGGPANHAIDWSTTDPSHQALLAAQAQAAQQRGGTFNVTPDDENS